MANGAKVLPHFLPLIFLLALLVPISGTRHLWQDEIETAERARTILETGGVPRVFDSEGRVSLNAGGQEIEEGTLHRYTPWGQFYWGALGLGAGRALGAASEDAALRFPFIFAHGAVSSLLSYGLTAVVGLPVAASVGLAALYGAQTVRILHHRTSRYHGLVDLLLMLGMLGLGLRSQGKKVGAWLLGAAVFFLPHVHTLGGSLSASLLVVAALVSEFGATGSLSQALRKNLGLMFAALISLGVLVSITRPWAQGSWAMFQQSNFRSIKSGFEIAYSFYVYVAGAIFLFVRGRRREAVLLGVVAGYVFLASRLLDLHPFSQTRYYLAIPTFFLFWPVALPRFFVTRPNMKWTVAILALGIILPETQGVIRPWQGLRVVAADYGIKARGEKQPLAQAFQLIRDAGGSGAVLVDYVPQLSNWYLRDRQIALMPDRATITKLNVDNSVWKKPLLEPEWHVSYLGAFKGQWNCAPNCDYQILGGDRGVERYVIHSKALARDFEMCVLARWITDQWNNAPFSGYETEALKAEGKNHAELVVARRCR